MNVIIHIERLLVDETVAGRCHAPGMKAEIQSELRRLLAHGVGSANELVRGTTIAGPRRALLSEEPKPQSIGVQIARSVHRQLVGDR